jgi:hypothetical protein
MGSAFRGLSAPVEWIAAVAARDWGETGAADIPMSLNERRILALSAD